MALNGYPSCERPQTCGRNRNLRALPLDPVCFVIMHSRAESQLQRQTLRHRRRASQQVSYHAAAAAITRPAACACHISFHVLRRPHRRPRLRRADLGSSRRRLQVRRKILSDASSFSCSSSSPPPFFCYTLGPGPCLACFNLFQIRGGVERAKLRARRWSVRESSRIVSRRCAFYL